MNAAASACRNCDSALAADQRFCGACGQRATSGRLTTRDIAHDLIHAFTHADHSIFALVKGIATRPGYVAREYIEGRRKRYFGPFAFLVIMVGVASAVIYLLGVEWFTPVAAGPARIALQKHFNLVVLFQTPIVAAGCALLFPRERLNYAEHLVLAAYASGFRVLFLALVETPLIWGLNTTTSDPALVYSYVGLWFAYFAWATSQFYRGNRWWSACKALLAVALSQAATVLAIYLFLAAHAGFATH